MTVARGQAGNLRMDTESSLGTAASSAVYIRPDEVILNRTQTRYLIENSNAGKRHPFDKDAPAQPIEMFTENALSLSQRIRRADTDGATPTMETLLKSAGWTAEVTSAATTTTGTPAVDAIDISADVADESQAILIERDSGVYVPRVIDDYDATPTITPSINLSSAPAASRTVEIMHTFSTATQTVYEVPTDQTLQFQYNTWGQYDDSDGDMSMLYTGCAVGGLDAIEIGQVGSVPMLKYNIHAAKINWTADDIAAETFQDSDKFAVITDDFECQIRLCSGLTTSNAVAIEKATINPGLVVKPIHSVGAGTYGGIQGYTLEPTAPTISVTGYWEDQSAFEQAILTEQQDDNSPFYIHFVQPTRDLDVPAFGIWCPVCYLSPEGLSYDPMGDFVRFTANFTASIARIDSESNITEVGASPIYIAVSGEAA
jgi:hypothetical protein